MQVVYETNPSLTVSSSRETFGLTPRERQITKLVSAGYSNRDLAEVLGISELTAEYHLGNVYDKLGVSNRLELVLFALHKGLARES
jgi:DNA-binding CsgD family transcriptional regulator